MKKIFGILLLISIAFIFMGCASSHMRPVSQDIISSYAPQSNEASVVFMRPSRAAGAVQSSVFDVTTDENVLVGIVSSRTKVAYKVSPGEHLFMVVGESADFIKANVEGGRTYYAMITPRIGFWKARFSLKTMHKADLDTADFKKWEGACTYVENTESALQWARDNAESIQAKRVGYYRKWIAKPESDRPVLNKEDGI